MNSAQWAAGRRSIWATLHAAHYAPYPINYALPFVCTLCVVDIVSVLCRYMPVICPYSTHIPSLALGRLTGMERKWNHPVSVKQPRRIRVSWRISLKSVGTLQNTKNTACAHISTYGTSTYRLWRLVIVLYSSKHYTLHLHSLHMRCNAKFIAKALELLQPCTKPSIYVFYWRGAYMI